jgi:hypothetical protein
VADSITHPDTQAQALLAASVYLDNDRARQLVRSALQVGRWQRCITEVARLEPAAAGEIAVEYLATVARTGSDDQQAPSPASSRASHHRGTAVGRRGFAKRTDLPMSGRHPLAKLRCGRVNVDHG